MRALLQELEAEGISAERKSLYDDFAVLGDLGYSVSYRRTPPAGYYLADRPFEAAELKLLIDAVQASRFITPEKSERLIRKIAALAGDAAGGLLRRQVYVANRTKTGNTEIYENVDEIHRAISEGRQIAFRYYRYNTEKKLVPAHEGNTVVSPFSLAWDDENYYLIAYDSTAGKIKHYRVDKMRSLAVLPAAREGNEQFQRFDMAAYSRATFGMFGGEEQLVTLECKNTLIGVFLDRFGQEIVLLRGKEGFFRTSVRVMVSPLFFSFVAGFGGDVRIVSPPDVREKFRAHLAAVADAEKEYD